MIYRRLGSTNNKVSLLSFGTMRLPRVSVKASSEVLSKANELGINLFETSPGYGNAERKLGIALKDKILARDKIFISTKSNPMVDDLPHKLYDRINNSLERLKTSYVDFYQVWGLNTNEDFNKVFENGLIEQILNAKKQKLIRNIGFTTHANPALIKRVIDTGYFDFVTLIYNLFKQDNKSVIDYANSKGMGVLVIAPLSNGFLAHPTEYMKKDFAPYDVREFALRWLYRNKKITSVVSGMKTLYELESNYKSICSFAGSSSADNYTEGTHEQKIWRSFKERGKYEYCDSCNKCLPCHVDINIPELMRLNNIMNAYKASYYCEDRYRFMGNGGSWYPGVKASHCDDCGDCEARCPCNLKIVSIIKSLHNTLYTGERKRLSLD